jgi:hypothetical protein
MSLSKGTATFVIFKFNKISVGELAEKLNAIKIDRAKKVKFGFTSGKLILDNTIGESSIHGEILHVQFAEEKPRIDKKMLNAQIELHIECEKSARGVEFLPRKEISEIKKSEEALMLATAPYTRSGVEALFDCENGLGYFGSSSEAKYDAFACLLYGNGMKPRLETFGNAQPMLTALLSNFSPKSVIMAPNGGAKFVGNNSSVALGDCASDFVISNCAIEHERRCVQLGLVTQGSSFTLSEMGVFSKFKCVEGPRDRKDIIGLVACFHRAYNDVTEAFEEFLSGGENGNH